MRHVRRTFMRLRRAVGGHETSLLDGSLGHGVTQAGGLEIRPGLFGALAAHGLDVEAIGLGEDLRSGGFDLRGKTGKNGQRGGDESSDSDR
jgi:hypothetical protein